MSDLPALSGVALVTGAASGIGKEVAFSFAEGGCRGVVFADINHDAATAAAKESQSFAADAAYRALAVRVDVTDLQSVQDMVDLTVREFGRVYHSVNAAGIANLTATPTASTDFTHFNHVLDTNLKGTAHCIAIVAKAMLSQPPLTYTPPHRRGHTDPSSTALNTLPPRTLGRGAIINIGSIYSTLTRPSSLAYTASKHGVLGLTKAAALDHARDGIRVNVVCPGVTDTPMFRSVLDRYPAMQSAIARNVPWEGRMASTREVAAAVLWLCSRGASYVTGACLGVDGGVGLSHGGVKI